MNRLFIFLNLSLIALCGQAAKSPNLSVIHTDEHNFRTLGCYRDLLPKEQAFIWGEGVAVETPNIDRIAREGAIATSYYATSPVCTPSRAGMWQMRKSSQKNLPHHHGKPEPVCMRRN